MRAAEGELEFNQSEVVLGVILLSACPRMSKWIISILPPRKILNNNCAENINRKYLVYKDT